MNLKLTCSLFLIVCLTAQQIHAGDWPQILGQNRDGIAVGETLLAKWPAAGPQQLWSKEIGEGFAGVAIKDGTVVLFHRKGAFEVVETFNAATGQPGWTAQFPCDYQSGMSSDSGPRCVPIITDTHVYTFGAQGKLRCVTLSTGEEVWSRDTWKDFSAPEGYFGAGSSPVLFEDRLIVNVGGRDNAAVVAFSAENGTTLWQQFDDTASYSSPIIAIVDGTAHAVVVTRLNAVSLNPANGEIRFQFPFGMRGPTVNGATPVVIDDRLFLSASYRVGSVWAKISNGEADVTPSGEKLLATQYATPIKHGKHLYAVDGRQDVGSATLKCIDPAGQTVLWERGDFDYGSLIRVSDDLLFLTNRGELVRFAADPKEYLEKQRCQVLEPAPRGYRLPAISNGRLYVRNNSTLKCLLVGDTAEVTTRE